MTIEEVEQCREKMQEAAHHLAIVSVVYADAWRDMPSMMQEAVDDFCLTRASYLSALEVHRDA